MSRSFVDFDELTELYRGDSALVYRAVDRAAGRSVILKTTASAFPTETEIATLRHEYELLASHRIAGIVTAEELIVSEHRYAIVFEDIGGESLAQAMQREPFTVDELYDLAISLSDALAQLHSSGVIHKDISANNVVIDRLRGCVQLIDFDSATILTRENPHLAPITYAEGTLEYMSPEQTGRMNRTIDYRSDFYSLGATLYHVASGRLPFDATDPIELVHAHIAREPLPLGAHRPALPRSFVAIVAKLMSKNAEDRYQSPFGLKTDLQRSRALWKGGNPEAELELGSNDFSGRLRISQKLYGREADVATMIAAFDDCCRNVPGLVLLAGEPGIGKTSIAQEIFAPVAARRGFHASGKFDQLHRTVPYLPVMTAFGFLVRQVLTESPEKIARWKIELDAALGGAAQVLIELVPELQMVIGAQPPVPSLPAVESQNRLYHVCQRFLSVFARPEHPIVLFFDDLQWADLGSLGLLQHILASSTSSLLVIGAYRSNEVYEAHPAMMTLSAITASGVPTTTIDLAPLRPGDILAMVADTLDTPLDRARPLAELVESKTAGNPFFANEFLKSIHDEGLIRADLEKCLWVWKIESLVARDMTDNVVELMVGRIEKLPATTRRMLEYAACIGSQFDLSSLSVAGELRPALAAIELRDAIAGELIRPVGTDYRLVELATGRESELPNVVYRFAHDRIRQAAYSLIDEGAREEVHWRLGMLLSASLSGERITNEIFAIVDHLNLGYGIERDGETARRIARLNLLAGLRARESSANRTALDYFEKGITRLDDDAWSSDYQLALDLFTHATQAANLVGDFERMEALAHVALDHARTVLEKVAIHEERLLAYHNQHRMTEAIAVGIEVLALLGVDLPSAPTQDDVMAGMGATFAVVGDRDPAELLDLPEMRDAEKLAAIRILLNLFSPAYVGMPDLYPLIVFSIVELSIRSGNTSISARGYAGLGMILCGVVGDIDRGYRFGRLAMDLVDRFDAEPIRASTGFMYNAFIRHWKEPHRTTLEPLLDLYRSGLETGDLQFAALAAFDHCFNAFWSAMPLAELDPLMSRMSDAIAQIKQGHALHLNRMYHQAVLNFIQPTDDPQMLVGELYDEQVMLPGLLQANDYNGLSQFYLLKAILCYTFNRPADADAFLDSAEPFLMGAMGTPCIPMWHVYRALTALSIAQEDPTRRESLLERAMDSLVKVQGWASFAPENYQGKALLIEALVAAVEGRERDARELFDRAIDTLSLHGFVQEAALAGEIAGRFHSARGNARIARHYLLDARAAYQTWGATAKAALLDAEFSHLIGVAHERDRTGDSARRSGRRTSSSLDISSVLKASHAIAREIVLDRLLEKLMIIVMENAGASRGALLLMKKGELVIEAEGEIGSQQITVLHGRRLGRGAEDPVLAEGIVNFVAHTRESVVLSDEIDRTRFAADPYILRVRPLSVLCLPLLNQGDLVGVLYLENQQTVDAFTAGRIELLNMLSSEIAIAIENARLYADISALNTAYERFVPRQFLAHLEKKSIVDVALGDQVQREMTVMFADIRDFTTRSEKMSPAETFQFVNAYLGRMEPVIKSHHGFIDKYIGDGIMALFPTTTDDAVAGAVAMLRELARLNADLSDRSIAPIEIGIGLNTGRLMLGTVGGESRMDGTVISDAVNLAARIEGLTKYYGVPLLLGEDTWNRLRHPASLDLREIDRVRVKGKGVPIRIFEVFMWESEAEIELKRRTAAAFAEGLAEYRERSFDSAHRIFHDIAGTNPLDRPARIYMLRCEESAASVLAKDWDGTHSLLQK